MISYHGSVDRPVDEVVQQLRPGVHLDHVHPKVRVEQQVETKELVAIVPEIDHTLQILYYVNNSKGENLKIKYTGLDLECLDLWLNSARSES